MRTGVFIILLAICSNVKAQIPVEIFLGHEKTTIDIMFFKYFKNKETSNDKQRNRLLFFNRNRASIDYRMTKTSYLPQFGFTEAISYNHEKLRGFAPVAICQVFNRGVFPKAGIQYVLLRDQLTFFSWLVFETLKTPQADHFLLFRYSPKLTDKVRLFTQFESLSTFPTIDSDNLSFTQRFRLGCSFASWQVGAGLDMNETGRGQFSMDYNIGSFIRYEF